MSAFNFKQKLNEIEFIQVDKFYPSSKTCSCCGNIKKDLKLSDRMYKCDVCIVVQLSRQKSKLFIMN